MKAYAIDVEIISDRHEGNFLAAQVDFCIAEFCKAIGAPENIKYADGEGEADGKHGWLGYDTDEHHFHRIVLQASPNADLNAIIAIAAEMRAEGCTVFYGSGDNSFDVRRFREQLDRII